MRWRLFPRLAEPDFSRWQRHFPEGVGPSSFSSPGFQRVMLREHGQGWQLRHLRVVTAGKCDLTLPIFGRVNRYGRYDLKAFPTTYYAVPLEADLVTAEIIMRVFDEVDRIGVSTFVWSLPPWGAWDSADINTNRYYDRLKTSRGETYIITCDTSYEHHIARRVRKTRRYEAKISMARGLEVISSPTPDLIDEYYQLYTRVYMERQWAGHLYSRPFFEDVAYTLGLGGKLYLMRFMGRIVGGGVLLIDRHAVHYFQGCVDRTVKNVFPHAVLYSEALKYAYEHRLRYVNLGGVNLGNDTLAEFKQSWSAEATSVPCFNWRCSMYQVGRMSFRSLRLKLSNSAHQAVP